ncbi:MAG: hypothetical protein AAF467_20800 [Actinomycetota bacterium]
MRGEGSREDGSSTPWQPSVWGGVIGLAAFLIGGAVAGRGLLFILVGAALIASAAIIVSVLARR